MTQTQTHELLLTQLISSATLAWLKKNNLPEFHLVANTKLTDGTLEMNFGIPSQHNQEALIADWLNFAKKSERLHVLLMLISESRKMNVPEETLKLWRDEGEKLHAELFS